METHVSGRLAVCGIRGDDDMGSVVFGFHFLQVSGILKFNRKKNKI